MDQWPAGTIQLRQQASSRLESWRHLRDVAYHGLPITTCPVPVQGRRCQGTGNSLSAGGRRLGWRWRRYVLRVTANEPTAAAGRTGAVITAGFIGGVAGAALAGHRGARAAALGAAAGAAGLAVVDAVARARQRPGEIPALWSRIVASAALAAPLGWAAGRLARAGPVGSGRRPGRSAACSGSGRRRCCSARCRRRRGGRGAGGGGGARCRRRWWPRRRWSAYRVLSALVFRDPQVSLLAERVPRRGPAVRRAAGGADPLRRHRLRARAGRRARRHATSRTRPTSASSPRSTSWPARSSTRPASTRWCASSTSTPPGSRLDIVPRVAAVGASRLPALPHRWWRDRSARPTCR